MIELNLKDIKAELLLAKGKHLLFKSRLRSYIHDSSRVEEELLVNHLACDLGKWIEKVKPKFDGLPALARLDAVHQEVHSIARELVQQNKARNKSGVQEKFLEAENVLKKVLTSIDEIEIEVKKLKID